MSFYKQKLHNIIDQLDEDSIHNLISLSENLIKKNKPHNDFINADKSNSILLLQDDFKNIVGLLGIDTSKSNKILKDQWNRDIC